MADLCSRLLADGSQFTAAPVAVSTDLAEADAALELAVHAPDQASCATALILCAQWLRWAQGVYEPDSWQANRAACAASTVEGFATSVPSDLPGLAAFQQQQLFPFHGVIGALLNDTVTVGPARAGALDFYAVAGAVLITVIGWSYLDYKQARGGYRPAQAGRI